MTISPCYDAHPVKHHPRINGSDITYAIAGAAFCALAVGRDGWESVFLMWVVSLLAYCAGRGVGATH